MNVVAKCAPMHNESVTKWKANTIELGDENENEDQK
ncbi:Uncharacterised protein [Paenibacillus macerans]|nr:Uncharacterised protein [Paenibacillus macerans]